MRVTTWLLRITLLGYAALAVGQPILAGSYLSGNFDAISTHGRNGGLLMVATMVTFVTALAHWLAGGRGWPVPTLVVLFLATGFQLGFGYERMLLVHLPLGVAIVGAVVAMAVWSWTPGSLRRRPRRRRAGRAAQEREPEAAGMRS